MAAYYNEIDPYAAAWLRNLIAAGHIAPGDVDERSIEDVRPADLLGYAQCHFFAGIGVWSYALRSAGWSDDRPVWTGSCPCQPFSAAGKRGGTADERHLWPAWEWLIRHAKPRGVPVLGEQVASKDGLAWFDLVHADLEGQGYTVRALDLCAAGVGAPHIRQRLWFVADCGMGNADVGHSGQYALLRTEQKNSTEAGGSRAVGKLADSDEGRSGRHGGTVPRAEEETERSLRRVVDGAESRGAACKLVHTECDPRGARRTSVEPAEGVGAPGARPSTESRRRGVPHVMGDANNKGPQGRSVPGATAGGYGPSELAARSAGAIDGGTLEHAAGEQMGVSGRTREPRGAVNGYWHDAEWLPCIDGKARPVEPGTFPLAHGAPARVGRLRAYGNAIVAPVAIELVRAYLAESALNSLR